MKPTISGALTRPYFEASWKVRNLAERRETLLGEIAALEQQSEAWRTKMDEAEESISRALAGVPGASVSGGHSDILIADGRVFLCMTDGATVPVEVEP